MPTLTADAFEEARARVAPHVYHTPLSRSRQLGELTGYDVRLKAEVFLAAARCAPGCEVYRAEGRVRPPARQRHTPTTCSARSKPSDSYRPSAW